MEACGRADDRQHEIEFGRTRGDVEGSLHGIVARSREREVDEPRRLDREGGRGEATERVGGDTKRLREIAEVSVYPMSEDRVDDWLRRRRTAALPPPTAGNDTASDSVGLGTRD